MFRVFGTVQETYLTWCDLAEEYPNGDLDCRISIVVIENRGSCSICTCELKRLSGSDSRKCICQDPGKHLFLPGSCCRKDRLKGRAFIRDVIIRAVGKFIKAVGISSRSALSKAKLEYLIMVRPIQPVSGFRG